MAFLRRDLASIGHGATKPVQRPKSVKNFERYQVKRSLENSRFLHLCVFPFGHNKEDTLLPLDCP